MRRLIPAAFLAALTAASAWAADTSFTIPSETVDIEYEVTLSQDPTGDPLEFDLWCRGAQILDSAAACVGGDPGCGSTTAPVEGGGTWTAQFFYDTQSEEVSTGASNCTARFVLNEGTVDEAIRPESGDTLTIHFVILEEQEIHADEHGAAGDDSVTITEAQISDLAHTTDTDTGPVPDCTGTDGQLADGSCADLATQAELDARASSIDVSDDTNLGVTAPVTLTGDVVGLDQDGGTDVTVDLEEETHAQEHEAGSADPVTAAGLGAVSISALPTCDNSIHGVARVVDDPATPDDCTTGGGGAPPHVCVCDSSGSPDEWRVDRRERHTFDPSYDAVSIGFEDGQMVIQPAVTGDLPMTPTQDGRSCRGGAEACDESYCSSGCPCPLGAGDCDADDECLGDLVCRSATLSEVDHVCSSVPSGFQVCDLP